MKWNWGTKIGLLYGVFVAFTIFMVYKAFGEKYELVTEDYYAQEIKYQETINSKQRADELDKNLLISVERNQLKVLFPQQNEKIEGSITCFRPSDESKDFTVEFKTTEDFYFIPLQKFSKGKYTLKLDWKVDETSFYKEQTVIIP